METVIPYRSKSQSPSPSPQSRPSRLSHLPCMMAFHECIIVKLTPVTSCCVTGHILDSLLWLSFRLQSCRRRASCSCCAAKLHIQAGGKVGCGVTSCYFRPLLVLILHIPGSKGSRVKRSSHNAFRATKPLSCYAEGLSLNLTRGPLSSVL